MADVSIETTIATSRVPIVVYLGTIPSKAEFKLDFYVCLPSLCLPPFVSLSAVILNAPHAVQLMAKRFSMLSEAVKEAFESFCQQLCLDSSTHRFFVTSEDDNTPLDLSVPPLSLPLLFLHSLSLHHHPLFLSRQCAKFTFILIPLIPLIPLISQHTPRGRPV